MMTFFTIPVMTVCNVFSDNEKHHHAVAKKRNQEQRQKIENFNNKLKS